MATLFDKNLKENLAKSAPLAERIRPCNFDEFFGQEEVVGAGKPLRRAIESDALSSLILWGPPGSGKTTLARIIAAKTKAFFQPFSAVINGIPELKGIIKEAEERLRFHNRRTILFVDEIHRFNKAQQDAFLPHVEKGVFILIGATTQNPSFEVISPLLSRSLVIVLKTINDEAMEKILLRALKIPQRGLGHFKIGITKEAFKQIVNFSNGDARQALNLLEFSVTNSSPDSSQKIKIDLKSLADIFQKKFLRYDKDGEEHYNLISAFIKSMRDSDPDAALYWLARMIEAGEDPQFIARRMLIFASEDIGNADPQAIMVVAAVAQAVDHVGLPEAKINLAQAATYLASAPKDNASYVGIMEASADAQKHGNLEVPMHLRNAVTGLMEDMGYGENYKYAHNFLKTAAAKKFNPPNLPSSIEEKKYYRPKAKPR